eukprot:5001443-Prymnesium_polylepis.1
MVNDDAEVKKVVNGSLNAIRRAFEQLAEKGPRKLFGKSVITLDQFCRELAAKKVIGDVVTAPRPAVQGMQLAEVHTNLNMLDVKGAFVTGQRGDGGGEGNQTLDLEEFAVCLA